MYFIFIKQIHKYIINLIKFLDGSAVLRSLWIIYRWAYIQKKNSSMALESSSGEWWKPLNNVFQRSRKAPLTLNCKHYPKLNDALTLNCSSVCWWHSAESVPRCALMLWVCHGLKVVLRNPKESPALPWWLSGDSVTIPKSLYCHGDYLMCL